MAKPHFKQNLLPHLIGLALGSAAVAPALAQEAAPAAGAQQLETVEIRGVRATLKKNLSEKRESGNIVDSISAEDVGKFPDKNVADSLQRVPGISVDRIWGEGKAIFVRGTDKNLNMTQLNGQAVASSEWWLNEPQTRSFNYDVLPSEIVGSLDVFKSPSADLDEGSIGGLVIVKTRRPLAFKDQLTVQAAAEAMYSKLPGKTDPQLSGLLNWKNDAKTFGVLLAISSQKRHMRRDGLEQFSDGKYDIQDQNGNVTNAYASWGGGSAIFRQERERTTTNLALQFQPNPATDIVLNLMDSDMKMNNNNQNYLWQAGGLAVGGVISVTDPKFISTSDGSKALVGGTVGPKTGVSFEPIYRQSYIKSRVADLDGSYQAGNWKLHGQLGTTSSEGGSSHDRHFWMEGDTRTTISLGPDHYGVKYLDISPLDPKALTLKSGDDRVRRMEGRENYAQGDVTLDIDNSVITAVKFGAKLRDNTLKNTRTQGSAGPGSAGWQSFSLADLSSGPSPLLSQAAATSDALTQYAWFDDGLVASKGIPMFDKAMTYKDVPNEDYRINERISAVYGRADFAAGKLRGDFGLRVVRTEQTSEGFLGNATGGFSPTSVKNSYTDALPNLNAIYELSKEVVLRGAIGKTMARQTFDLLSPGLRRDGTVLSKAYAGNPMLKPVHANQAEFGAEWYYADAALLSGTFFVKKLDTFTYKASKSEQVGSETLTVERPYNADNGADIKGFELQWQQPFGHSGFGTVVNYTYTDAVAGAVAGQPHLKVLGNSRDQFNFSGYYEQGSISLRISYNYRSKSYGDVEMGGQVVNAAYGQWDASASWDVTNKITVYASAVNLNNEVIRSNTVDGIPIGVYENGPRYSLGVRAKF
ncbi:TonB-dependent receptor [Roseateles saccharophilus]|uniref:Iron complex outermembrane receptor protein n=1 Tax=Roseateles saccharophilus TaxID=304 RepID=A0A4R3UJZ9_ROSSA|nr:TonB-dependent receptor [Roseateles saccharophilus]MDG0833934.1 TonB-dependent receptor [Roseateles saccharophilus]TCU91122.1 iron complex outermembrane receptor protein [Roseateles saccharophilus]